LVGSTNAGSWCIVSKVADIDTIDAAAKQTARPVSAAVGCRFTHPAERRASRRRSRMRRR
jgi:hypothetical protein